MKPFNLLALGAVAIALIPALAMASSLTAGVGSGADITVGTGVDVTTGGSVNADATTNTNANSGSGDASVGGSGSAGGMLMITQDDAMSAPSTVTSSGAVANDADFNAYAKSTLQSNSQIKEVDADGSSVALKYAEPARLFGLFPVSMNATAKVAADGSVTFSYPWYSFLAVSSTDNAKLRAALSAEAASAFKNQPSKASEGATSTVQAMGTLSASQKAKLLDAMRLVLSGSMSAHTTTSANGSASGSY